MQTQAEYATVLSKPEIFAWANALAVAEYEPFYQEVLRPLYRENPSLAQTDAVLRNAGNLPAQLNFAKRWRCMLADILSMSTEVKAHTAGLARRGFDPQSLVGKVAELETPVLTYEREMFPVYAYHGKRGYLAWLLGADGEMEAKTAELAFRDAVMRCMFPVREQYESGISNHHEASNRLAQIRRQSAVSFIGAGILTQGEFECAFPPEEIERIVREELLAYRLREAERIYV